MARDGSGTFTVSGSAFVNGTTADADEVNSKLNDIADGLTDSINIAGTKAFGANQPMAGFKFTGLGAGGSNGDSVRYEQLTALASVYQPLDATLTAFAAQTTAADKLWYWSGVDAGATTDFTAFGRSVAALADAAAGRTLFGLGTAAVVADNTLVHLAGTETLTGAKTFSETLTVNKGSGGASNFVVGGANAQDANVQMIANAGQNRAILSYTGSTSQRRWALLFGNNTAESGANAGSNFSLNAYDDSNVFIGQPLSIVRATMAATFGGQVLVPAGSASAPAYSFSGDTNTGIFSDTADQIKFTMGGTTRFTMTANNMFGQNTGSGVMTSAAGAVGTPTFAFVGDTDSGMYRIGADNIGLAAGGSKIVDIATTGIVVTGTLKGRTETSSEASGTLTAASANTVVKATGGITINDGVFTAGDHIEVYNDSDSSITITQDTGMTLRLAGTTSTGNRTLAARGIAIIYFDTNADATVGGTGVS